MIFPGPGNINLGESGAAEFCIEQIKRIYAPGHYWRKEEFKSVCGLNNYFFLPIIFLVIVFSISMIKKRKIPIMAGMSQNSRPIGTVSKAVFINGT